MTFLVEEYIFIVKIFKLYTCISRIIIIVFKSNNSLVDKVGFNNFAWCTLR